MDFSSVSQSRYAQRSFQPQMYSAPAYGPAGGAFAGGAAASPLPGSGWAADSTVWVSQSREVASLERAHVSELGNRMLARMEGLWETQSWAVRRFKAELNSVQRAAQRAEFMTRSAVDTMMALSSKLTTARRSVDVYA